MTFEEILRQRLAELRGTRSMKDLAAETGINPASLYRILAGERGFGACTLEQLRISKPELIADLFSASAMEQPLCPELIKEVR